MNFLARQITHLDRRKSMEALTGSVARGDVIFNESIVVDAVCPLLYRPKNLSYYKEGGVTVCAPTISSSGQAGASLKTIGSWLQRIRSSEDLHLVLTATDVEFAKKNNKLGILMHFQGADPIEDNIDLIDAFAAVGVRMIQLTYNVKNRVGDGCAERTDAGLSIFGVKMIERMNQNHVIVDCSHTGRRTTLDAISASSAPVVFSHANPDRVVESPRNVTDEQIKAIAQTGGLIGANGWPPFVAKSARPTIDQFIDHMAYVSDLVGVDHVGLGIDYYSAGAAFVSEDEAARQYVENIECGRWNPETYPAPPWHMPEGLETPRQMPFLCSSLLKRGFSETETKKILGGNWLRVFREVFGP
jgi:membrane dipeptidase